MGQCKRCGKLKKRGIKHRCNQEDIRQFHDNGYVACQKDSDGENEPDALEDGFKMLSEDDVDESSHRHVEQRTKR